MCYLDADFTNTTQYDKFLAHRLLDYDDIDDAF